MRALTSLLPVCLRTIGLSLLALLTSCMPRSEDASGIVARFGDPEAGRRIIARIECGMCHAIPGVAGTTGGVGPPLAGFAQRRYFAGSQPNEPERVLQWILNPPSLSPSTAMPRMPIDPDEARDVVAYLYTLR